ncbi:sensor domain-containing diguanylate cyclase [Kushneria phosphatilytica]|nr:GGDEF domain-containing protein [Kushneria phosphatilytica]OHV08659.1 hypothetical protein BH688_11505 [Kushneria phosphatilytica]
MHREIAELDRLLAAEGVLRRVAIPSALQQAFATHGIAYRRHVMVLSLIATLVLYMGFGLLDWLMVPDLVGVALSFRFGIVLPCGLAVLYLLRQADCPFLFQQMAVSAYLLLGVALLAILVGLSTSLQALGFLIGNYAILICAVIAMALPFEVALIIALVGFAIQTAAIVYSPVLPPILLLHNLLTGFVILGPALVANWMLENERRRHFLMLRREQVRLRQLAGQRDLLGRLAALDPLTGLANRRGFYAALNGDIRADVSGLPMTVAMIDVDSFKAYNDQYGHPAGDEALQSVAAVLDTLSEPNVRVGRLGGEEFAVAMTALGAEAAITRIESLHASIQRLGIPHHYSSTAEVLTISVGVARGPVREGDIESLFRIADEALYQAKRAGRNRVVILDATPTAQ